MDCPVCGSAKTKVTRTALSKPDSDLYLTNIMRTRRCRSCEHQFVSIEITQPPRDVVVAKKNNKSTTFSYEKLYSSIQRTCANLRIPYEQQRRIFTNVMKELIRDVETENKKQILSSEIGAIVMRNLKPVNRIAWLRYLSHFDDNEESIKKSLRQWFAEDIDEIE